jgi:hypothetical protein
MSEINPHTWRDNAAISCSANSELSAAHASSASRGISNNVLSASVSAVTVSGTPSTTAASPMCPPGPISSITLLAPRGAPMLSMTRPFTTV